MINKYIVERIAKQTDVQETQIDVILSAFCDIVVKQVANGQEVKLKDYFTFYTARKNASIKIIEEKNLTERIKNNPLFDSDDNTLLVPATFKFSIRLEKFSRLMYKQITKKKR